MEFEAKPPSALYKEAGKFLVLNTIDVMTFFFVLIFLLSFEKTKNLVILFFESSKFFFKIFNPYIFEDNSEPIAAKFSFLIDVESHPETKNFKNALKQLEKFASKIKILGFFEASSFRK